MLCITTTVFGSVLAVETEKQFIATWSKHSNKMPIQDMKFHVVDTVTGTSQLNLYWDCFLDFNEVEDDSPFGKTIRNVTLKEVLATFNNQSIEV